MFTGIAVAEMMNKNKDPRYTADDEESSEEEMEVKKLFKCTICHARFTRRFNRDRHMELLHKVPRPDRPPLYPDVVTNAEPVLEPPPAIEAWPIGAPEPVIDVFDQFSGKKRKNKVIAEPEKTTKPVPNASEESSSSKKGETSASVAQPPSTTKKQKSTSVAETSTLEESLSSKKQKSKPVVETTVLEESPSSKKSKQTSTLEESPSSKKQKTKVEEPVYPEAPCDDLGVIRLPQETEHRGTSSTPLLAVRFCGSCNYFNRHRYILLNNGHAVVTVPMCERCNKLNRRIARVIDGFQKQMKQQEIS
jgi:hypothetical protein